MTHLPALILTALLTLPWPALAQPAQPAPSVRPTAPAPVIVALSTTAVDSVSLDVLGSGAARHSLQIFAPVSGEVAEVAFRTGQSVRAGQVLLRLVDRSQRLAADLASARVDAARALAARYEGTRGTGAVPESAIDEAQAALRGAQIELAQAREAMADRVVRAPFAGIVGLAGVERGDRVTPETVLTTLDDRRVLLVDFEVPEAYLSRVAPGQALTAVNPAYAGRAFEGKVAEIDSRVDPVSRNVRVRATLPNAGDLLRPGMSFQVRLSLPGKSWVSVPELALQWGREGSFVWVVREGKSVQVPARPVRRVDGRVLVDSALKAGESVVIEGVQRLRVGRGVRVVGGDQARAEQP